MPARYRALVGRTEIWLSLKTTDRRTANARIAVVSDDLERGWGNLAAEANHRPKAEIRLTHQDLHALQRETHVAIRDARIADPRGFGSRGE